VEKFFQRLDELVDVLTKERELLEDVKKEIGVRPKHASVLDSLMRSLESNCDHLEKMISELKKAP
jgi:hypothetical protein